MSLRFLNGYRHGLATRPLMEFRESVTVSDEFPRFRRALTRRFGIDSRALAALRVAVGVLLLADLTLRTRGLVGFYTDSGVLPRSLLGEQYPIFAKLSLHALSGAAWFELILFAVAGVAALAVVVGYRTRLAVFVSWLLLVSLHARNPLVLSAGDSLLRRLLFWGLFLPLGARWSVDAAACDSADRNAVAGRVVGVASVALLTQVLLVYGVNAALKLRGTAWLSGEAIQSVFSLEQFLVGVGPLLAQQPDLLVPLGYIWLTLLAVSPLLVGLTGRPRLLLVGLFAAAHLGMAATMRLGVFPFISVAALLPFLPPTAWDALVERTPQKIARRLAGWRGQLASRLPAGRLSVPDGLPRWPRAVVSAVAALFLVVMVVWNAAALGFVATPDAVNSVADPNERTWDMFAPTPLSTDGWYVAPGRLDSGERVDVFDGGSVEWDKPTDVSAAYPTWRWRKYLVDLWRTDSSELRHGFGGYLCRRWNATQDTELVELSAYYVAQETRLSGAEPVERVPIVDHSCEPTNTSGEWERSFRYS